MSTISSPSVELSSYRDQHFKGTRAEQDKLLRLSTTLYVGNLSFYTTEEQIVELFSKCGDIRRVVMGLDKYKKTPCGFCFVEYYNRADAENCLRYINGTRLDDRIVRTDWDAGFLEGRQYGRGKTGGQVRDEYRTDYDSGRGGYGTSANAKIRETRDFDIQRVGESSGQILGNNMERRMEARTSLPFAAILDPQVNQGFRDGAKTVKHSVV